MKRNYIILFVLGSLLASAQNAQYSVQKSTISIDGIFADWDSINTSSIFVNHQTGKAAKNSTVFKSAYDSNAVYFYFDVIDSLIVTTDSKRDDQIFNTDDCVELFIDFDGDGKNYLEIGINPNGVFYDYHIICPNSVCGFWENDATINLKNTAIKSIKTAGGYKIELSLSYEDLNYYLPFGFVKPEKSTNWKANFYNINKPIQQLNSWSVIGKYGFHHPKKFGVLTFK